jgi:sortase A
VTRLSSDQSPITEAVPANDERAADPAVVVTRTHEALSGRIDETAQAEAVGPPPAGGTALVPVVAPPPPAPSWRARRRRRKEGAQGPLNAPPPGVVRERPPDEAAPPGAAPADAEPQAGEPEGAAVPSAPVNQAAERTLLWLGLTAAAIGVCLILFLGYLFAFTGFQADRHQRALLNEFLTPSGSVALSGHVPADGDPVGVLSIPALGLHQVFVEGTSSTDLLSGPGLMPGTARPGTVGNSVIAGRRTTGGRPFARLGDLKTGDVITVTTGLGRFDYRVIRIGTAPTGSIDPVAETRRARLTLVTSNPALIPTGRLYVVANLTTKPASATVPTHPPSVAERGLAGDPDAVLPAVLWGLALAAVIAAVIWCYLRWRARAWTVYLLSTPILVALLFVFYENLIRLLPATM